MSLSSGFPNLPGFVSNKTKPAPRAQTFSVAGGLAVEKKRADEPEPDYTRALVERGLKARSVAPKVKADLAATKRDAPIAAAAVVPPHVLLARQVRCEACDGSNRTGCHWSMPLFFVSSGAPF